jgi:serine/threonine-protein kinase
MMADDARDAKLVELLDQLTASAREGSPADFDRITADYPDLADELRQLYGAAMVVDAVAQRSDSLAGGDPTQVADPSPAISSELPRRLGDYELREEIGRGGMGVVYRALQLSLNRTVAIKLILRGRHASPTEQTRFLAEAEAVARLEHPGIVPIFEVGSHEGQLFFSMKYIEGQTLAGMLSKGPLPGAQAAEILVKVARAIDYAHSRGVLHRDLKPANILIDEGGEPVVTDFGLAKLLSSDNSLTHSGAVLGTPSYMAPEQAAGSRGPLGPGCDVYSLGTLLYAMLTGRPPFQAASPVDTVLMVLEQDPLPPRLINAKADRDLELIALRCLQKPPELRYLSAGALADDLRAWLAGEPIAARSGQFSQVLARMFRETHHATVLENWGLLWMWHAAVLLVLCLITSWMQWRGVRAAIPYAALWGGGLAVWAPIFWAIRRRAGPVTFVERQIAHLWGASVIAAVLLFGIEELLGLEVLTLSPVLGLVSGMVFTAKAGILAGSFYVHAAALYATALIMALMQHYGLQGDVLVFGVAAGLTFFVPGLHYYRQRAAGGK